MVKEISTLDKDRPTTLDEKRRIERELGLPVEPNLILPRGNNSALDRPQMRKRFVQWLRGTPAPAKSES